MDGKVLALLMNVRVSFVVTGVSVSVFVGYNWGTSKLDLFILYLLISWKFFLRSLDALNPLWAGLTESYPVLWNL